MVYEQFILDKSKYFDYLKSERVFNETKKTLTLEYDWWVVNDKTQEKKVISYKYLLDVNLWQERRIFYKDHRTIGCAVRVDKVAEAEKKPRKISEKKIVTFEKIGKGSNVSEPLPSVTKEAIKEIEAKIKKEEQAEMVRKIVDTGARLEEQEASNFMSQEESISFYRQYKIKTNYAYYKHKETSDITIAIDMYKDDRFSMEDINFLSQIYQGLGVAYRSDVSVPLAVDNKPGRVKAVKETQPELVKENNREGKGDVVSQASRKLKQYNVISNEEFLDMQVSKRLWVAGETDTTHEWRIGDNDTLYIAESSKKSDDPMACLAHKREDYPDLVGLPKLTDGVLRHIVNAEIYDKRNRS